MNPPCQCAKLVIRKGERRHAGLRPVADQIPDLILTAASQPAVVHQRGAALRPCCTLSVAARAHAGVQLLRARRR